ncbi:hypothetical protein M407DRAFT_110742 [Tulasnella calospora MUT 4182]|uniref:Uncharacterized protein n=1 Tax=Tulasnella calospora MUT 4182 TaxID=1051891 RepID=A0A0C3KPF7_9AGAM|nr:hypothetical protein M407DRAFT_110742 [Tulasnella calospora MUT 4182]
MPQCNALKGLRKISLERSDPNIPTRHGWRRSISSWKSPTRNPLASKNKYKRYETPLGYRKPKAIRKRLFGAI